MPMNPLGLTKGLIERIRQRIKTEFGGASSPETQAHVEDTLSDPRLRGPATDVAAIMFRIRFAARTRTLLWMKYNNDWRHVEPYSFRFRSAGMQPLFMAYCEMHEEIHSFRIDRIQDVHNTDRPYAPRNGWVIEIT